MKGSKIIIYMASKVFGCEDLRKEILSYFPERCEHCKKKMNNLYINSYKYYWKNDWKNSKNYKMKKYCNWCYYYVFEYN